METLHIILFIQTVILGLYFGGSIIVLLVEEAQPSGWINYALLVWLCTNIIVLLVEEAQPSGWINYALLVWLCTNLFALYILK